jgi:hypothetical protein
MEIGGWMLFGQLNEDIFTLFSGSNRLLYEKVLVAVYENYFRADLHFPAQTEVIGSIYACLGDHTDLWHDEEKLVTIDQLRAPKGRRLRRRRLDLADHQATTEAVQRARHIYARLIQTGWLEESRYGLKVTVDMPSGAMRLAEFLCSLREGVSEQLGGLVIEVKTALEAVQVNASENALGLNKAARDAAAFGRYLRSVLSSLRDIDRQILASDSVARRLQHYFEDFVERVLLKDYAAIATTSHPYRFRHRIFVSLDAIEDSAVDIGALGDAYLEAHLGKDIAEARDVVHDDLFKIRRVFDRIEEAFVRIQNHRSRLETRLRNTVRYAGRRSGSFLQRSEPLLLQLDRLQAADRRTGLTAPGVLETRRELVSPLLLARPRNSRAPLVGGVLTLPGFDPVRELRKRLEREYLDRLAVTPHQISRFLERRVPPFGESHAANFWLECVDDFLAFEALRLIVAAGELDTDLHPTARYLVRDFEFEPDSRLQVDNDWLACGGFTVRRKGDRVTMDAVNVA